MTVQELIHHLRQLPQDHPVFVEGYENGWDSLVSVEVGHMVPQDAFEDWDGEFERLDDAGSISERGVLLVGRRGQRRKTGP